MDVFKLHSETIVVGLLALSGWALRLSYPPTSKRTSFLGASPYCKGQFNLC